MAAVMIDAAGLHGLVAALIDENYRVIGPKVAESAIILDELRSAEDLPVGWGVETSPGHYRLRRREDDAAFGHSAGPQSWKQFLHPPRQQLWSSAGTPTTDTPRYAFVGVRGCDLAAIAILNRVLGGGTHPNSSFSQRHSEIFVVAVNCTEPGGVCFCASMGTGPAVNGGFDLALTERMCADGRQYLVEVGTDSGARILELVRHRPASETDIAEAQADIELASHQMGRQMPDCDHRELLHSAAESPRWDDVANRCLTCGNCTMVCPTCFCTSVSDVSDLAGRQTERWMQWASCFEVDFSLLHQGPVRKSASSRYRQWLTHKFGTWHDQFSSSGCVGCGRCIAWCPTGIDVTEEMNALHSLANHPSTEQ
jgi:formate hydrogenlyase subunit 6/NADH:ubiquinone oxidoreductase subunit I